MKDTEMLEMIFTLTDDLKIKLADAERRADYWKEIAESRWRMILMLTERER